MPDHGPDVFDLDACQHPEYVLVRRIDAARRAGAMRELERLLKEQEQYYPQKEAANV